MASEWTIDTLREFLLSKIDSVRDKCNADTERLESDAKHVADNLAKDATEYARRLSDLNHEAKRIADANAANVSREVHDAFVTSIGLWQQRVEKALSEIVPQTEYRQYKESTEKALTTASTRRESGLNSLNVLFAIITAVVAVGVLTVGIIEINHSSTPNTVYVTLPPPSVQQTPTPSQKGTQP